VVDGFTALSRSGLAAFGVVAGRFWRFGMAASDAAVSDTAQWSTSQGVLCEVKSAYDEVSKRPLTTAFRFGECLLWVNFGLSRPTAATSAVGGKADALTHPSEGLGIART
jgi:hypothetical protein